MSKTNGGGLLKLSTFLSQKTLHGDPCSQEPVKSKSDLRKA
jgi:hypothetical protein